MLPTCRIHTKQQFKAGVCQARLQSGTKCNAKFRWEPYGFSLCPAHAKVDDVMPCYFLKIPTELRCRIYSFLLPDQMIPARFQKTFMLRSDSKPCYPQILRVNHQIYEEAAIVLYAQNTFEIEVSGGASIHMCNNIFVVQSFPTPSPARVFPSGNNPILHGHPGNHALQDYQMQLMLLEQQNKKRLLMARQERDNIDHTSLSPPPLSRAPPPRSRLDDAAFLSSDPNSHLHTSTWHPGRLSHANVNMIRFFQINILFPCVPQLQLHPHPTSQQILQQQMLQRQQQAHMAARQAVHQQQLHAMMVAQQQTSFQQQQHIMLGIIHPQPMTPATLSPLPPPTGNSSVMQALPPPPSTHGLLPPPMPPPPSSINLGPLHPMGIMTPQQGPPGPFIGMMGFAPNMTLPPPPPPGPRPQRIAWGKVDLERAQYETCDALNQVVERLQLLPLPILRLNVSIQIDEYEEREPALATAKLFLNTFRGLRNVVRPNVQKNMWANPFWQQKEIFYNLQDISVYPTTSSEFVNQWKAEISQQGPAPDLSPVVYAYWVLHHICFDLQAHHEAATVLESNAEIHTLLLQAKMAREAEDMAALRSVGQKIQTIWKSYLLKQRAFESRVSKKVAFVDGLLGSDDVEPSPVASSSSSSSRQSYEGKGKGRVEEMGDYYETSVIIKEEEEDANMMGDMHLCA